MSTPPWYVVLAMGLPATAVRTAPVLDVESVLSRLSAEARARLAWAKKPIADGLLELRTKPLTDELVESVAGRIALPMQAVSRAAAQDLSSNVDEYRAAFMQDVQHEETRLRSFVETENAQDTLEWIARLLRSFFALSMLVSPEEIAEVDESNWTASVAAPMMKPLWRGVAAMMAATDEAKRGSNAERARDLLDVAFLELMDFRKIARRYGAPFPVFPFETTDERRQRLCHYAERLRHVLTEDDASAIDSARLHNLR